MSSLRALNRKANLLATGYERGARVKDDMIMAKDSLMENTLRGERRAMTFWREYVLLF